MDSSGIFKCVLLLGYIVSVLPYHASNKDNYCASLYKAKNFTGEYFNVSQGSEFTNLEEEFQTHGRVWNVTESFQLQEGCTLRACSESYYEGDCRDFPRGVGSLSEEFMNILSISCSCPKKCTCMDFYNMRKQSCARAYLNSEGCNSCKSLYVQLDQGQSSLFPSDLVHNVTALMVRQGCNLTIFDGEEFAGNQHFVEGPVQSWVEPVRSYECICSGVADFTTTTPKLERPSDYPDLIDIPQTLENIQLLMAGDHEKHPGLMAALRSNKGKRSTKNAYILLLGTTGAGKSSAINLLFDNPNITRIGEDKSTTKDIHEFRIPVAVDELGIKNSELRVIDTPGLGDTGGIDKDAQFLATLDEYLAQHEELNKRIPNVVLVFHKFSDNRFAGEGSTFVKMIRGLDSLKNKITDKKYSNVIFVFSHFLHESSATKRNPKRKLSAFKKTIEEYSRFPRPIVVAVAENKAAEQDLFRINGYFKLPNGDYYPKNLFDRITQVTRGGEDAIGEAVIRSAFKDLDSFNVTTIDYPMQNSSKIPYYLGVLSAATFNLQKTELSEKLSNASKNMDNNLKKQYPDTLYYTQKSLNLMKFITEADLPKTTSGIVKLFTELRQNPAVFYLLETAFNLSPPIIQETCLAGYSYNIFKDYPINVSPFNMEETQNSEIGYKLPKMVSCIVDTETVDILHFHKNREEYINERIRSLNIAGNISLGAFTGDPKAGHNILEKVVTLDGNLNASITAIREFRTFQLVLNDQYTLTDDFKQVVMKLTPYNATDYQSVDSWRSFFRKYGTHVVKSVYGGGAINIELRTNKPFSLEIAKMLISFIQFAEDIALGKTGNATLNQEGVEHSLNFVGGENKFRRSDVTKLPLQDAADILENWRNSLTVNPTILTNAMSLIPISEVTKRLGQNVSAEIEKATAALFNSSLTYTPFGRVADEYPEGRSNMENLPGFEMFKTWMDRMAEVSRKSEEKLLREIESIKADERKAREALEKISQEKQLMEKQLKLENEKIQKERDAEAEKRRQEQSKHEEEVARITAYHIAQIEIARKITDSQLQSVMTQYSSRGTGNNAKKQPSRKGCLRIGTLMLMADLTEKPVELLDVGEMVMDHQLLPVRVTGVLEKFFLNDHFHGFDNETFFFTDTHQVVGSKNGSENQLQIYARDLETTIRRSPLLAYLNIEELPETSYILKYMPERNSVLPEKVELFTDPEMHSEKTIVYIIIVDSEIGTYIANGFVCRHELPVFNHWLNTLTVLFAFAAEPRIQWIKEVPYNIENVIKMEKVVDEAYDMMQNILNEEFIYDNTVVAPEGLSLSDEVISLIYKNPTIFAFAVAVYEKLGPALAAKIDVENSLLSELEIGRIQLAVYTKLSDYFAHAFPKEF